MTEYTPTNPLPTEKKSAIGELEAKKLSLILLKDMQLKLLKEIEVQISDTNGQINNLQKAERKAQYLIIRTLPFEEQLANFKEEDLFNPFETEVKENWEQLLQLAMEQNKIPDLLTWIGYGLEIKPIFTWGCPASIVMKRMSELFDLSKIDRDVQSKPTEEFWGYIAENIKSGEFPKK